MKTVGFDVVRCFQVGCRQAKRFGMRRYFGIDLQRDGGLGW